MHCDAVCIVSIVLQPLKNSKPSKGFLAEAPISIPNVSESRTAVLVRNIYCFVYFSVLYVFCALCVIESCGKSPSHFLSEC